MPKMTIITKSKFFIIERIFYSTFSSRKKWTKIKAELQVHLLTRILFHSLSINKRMNVFA